MYECKSVRIIITNDNDKSDNDNDEDDTKNNNDDNGNDSDENDNDNSDSNDAVTKFIKGTNRSCTHSSTPNELL